MKKSSTELVEILEERKIYLMKNLKATIKQMERLKGQDDHKIRVQKHGNGYQYYMRVDEKDTNGRYMKRSQEKEIRDCLQKEYLQKAATMLNKEIAIINEYLSKASPIALMKYCENMNDGRKRMIKPIEIGDKEYANQWMNIPYESKEVWADTPEYYTQKMERVRSKSEIIIANTLGNYGIPYRYEYPVAIVGRGNFYPDFTVLNVRKRKEMYWEHLGMMDDLDYREKAMRKIAIYEANDIFLGEKLIVTYESMEQPLNVKDVERKIEKYLM